MNAITVDKKQLMAIIQKNRDEHKEIYEEAWTNYKALCEKELEGMLADVRAGRVFRVSISLPAPMNQTREYDRALKMLEMDLNAQIKLEEHDFACYVMNEWTWMHQTMVSNSRYSAKARAKVETA